MNTLWYLVNLLVFTQFVVCRDFYLGMFKRNDFLVAQDVIYKAPAPFGYTTASYGRFFKCPITYFRVVDRLGQGRGPFTTIVRGGLRKKFISVRIKSTYRLPVSVNIYVGCENKQPSTFRSTTRILTTPLTTTPPPHTKTPPPLTTKPPPLTKTPPLLTIDTEETDIKTTDETKVTTDPEITETGDTPEDTTPEDAKTTDDTSDTPEDTTPEDTTPEDTTPEDTTPEDTTPE